MVESLEFEALKDFVRNRVEGKDGLLSDDRDGSREYPIIAIEPHLRRMTRSDIRRACIELLGEFVAGKWTDIESAHALLLLNQSLAPDEATDRLLLLVESPRFDELHPSIQYRVAQTFVELQAGLNHDFWIRLAERDWDRFGAISWNGISQNSLAEGIHFLACLPHSIEIAQKVSYSLPAFLKRLKSEPHAARLTESLASILPSVSAALRNEIVDWANQASFTLPQPSRSTLVDQVSLSEIVAYCWKATREVRTPVLQPAL